MKETLFDGVVNPVSFQLLDTRLTDDDNPMGTPIPFQDSGIVRMDLFIGEQVISNVSGYIGNITWDNNGNVNITSGDGVPEITREIFHTTKLVVYDNLEGENGTLMVDPRMQYSSLQVEVVDV